MTLPTLVLGAVAAVSPTLSSYHVVHVDGDSTACLRGTPAELQAFELRREQRQRHRRLSLLMDTYRDRDIQIDFAGDFPDEAKNAVLAAANMWEAALLIDVPIEIYVSWEDNVTRRSPLATCTTHLRVAQGFIVPSALANQLAGRDQRPSSPDLEIEIFDHDDLYFGTDGNPGPDELELISTVLHEIGHGLGITSSLRLPDDYDADEPTAEYYDEGGYRFRYDYFLWTSKHGWLFNRKEISNPSAELYEAGTGIKLLWGWADWETHRGGPSRAVQAHGGPIMISAFPDWFSTIDHLDKHAHPDSILTPSGRRGQVERIDAVILGMLYDMGWELKERPIDISDLLKCLETR